MDEFKKLLIIFIVTLLLFFYKIGYRPLWESDEAMHGQIAKEMVLQGDWITPTYDGIPFYDKPILHFWMVMLCFSLFGINEFSARFPSAILGLGGVLLVYLWASRIYSRRAGILSSLVLATSIEYIILSRNVIHDMSLSFFITLCLFLFHYSYKKQTITQPTLVLFFASLGCAVLAKGPIGVLLPALIIAVFLLLSKKGAFLLNKNIFWGILIFLMFSLPWYIAMALKNPTYLESFLLEGNLYRFFSAHPVHQQPLYYYLPVIAVGFFPWIIFLPAACVYQIRSYFAVRSSDTQFMFIAALFPLIFFSLSRTKLPTYIFPAFPPLAILVGTFWSCGIDHIGEIKWKRYFRYSSSVLSSIICLGSIAGSIYLGRYLPVYFNTGVPLMIILLISGLIIPFFTWREKVISSYICIILMMLAINLYSVNFVLPEISHYQSPKNLSLRLQRFLPPGKPLIFYGRPNRSVIFYTGRPNIRIDKKEGIEKYMNKPERIFCLMSLEDYETLENCVKDTVYLIDREGDTVLISNRGSFDTE